MKNEKIKDEIIKINEKEKMNLTLDITIENRKTKEFDLYGIPLQVPKPVVGYLEKEYNISFTDLMKKNE